MKSAKYLAICFLMIMSVVPLGSLAVNDEGPAAPRAVPRAVLGELFTATWCGYCPASDNAFNNLINNASYFPARFTAIEWHPTQNDQYGTSETDAVCNWYGIGGYPTAIFDGVSSMVGGSTDANDPAIYSAYKQRIDARPATSPIKLELDAKIVNNAITSAKVNVTAVDSVASYANLKVKAVLVEDLQLIHNNGNLRWTARDVLFSSDLSINQGETLKFSGSGSLGGGWDSSKLGVVAYVQSNSNKEVVQSIQVVGLPRVTDSPPTVASPLQPISFSEDSNYTQVNLNTVFGDPEEDPLTFGFSGNSKINVTVNNGLVTLTPVKDWSGTETVRFTAKDEFNAQVASNDVQVTVTPVNDPPVVKKFIIDFTMLEGGTRTGLNLDDIFSDVDSTLAFSVTGNSRINVTIGDKAPRAVTFVAADLWNGKEMITFRATDGQYERTAAVNVTVIHTNHAPTARAIADIVMDEDTVDRSIDLAKVFTDLDGFETLTITPEAPGGHIQVTIDGSNIVGLTPSPNWNGKETITFSATDSIADPISVQFGLTVQPVNDAPAVSGSLEKMVFDEDTIYASSDSLWGVFRDADGDQLTYSADYDTTKIGVEINNDYSVTIMPVKDFFGKVKTDFWATDPGGLFAVYSTNVTIENVNDQPVIRTFSPTSTKAVNLNEGDSQTFTVAAFDADSDILEHAWNLDGKLQDSTESEFVYKTDFKSAGIHKLTVVVSDPSSRVEMTWNIKVTDVNRAPVLLVDLPAPNAAYSSGEKVRLLASATDPDGDTLQYTWSENGAVIGKLADISNIFRSGTHTIRCEVTDGKEMAAKEITFTVKKPAANNQPGFEAVAVLGVLLLALVLLGRKR